MGSLFDAGSGENLPLSVVGDRNVPGPVCGAEGLPSEMIIVSEFRSIPCSLDIQVDLPYCLQVE